MGIFLPVWPSCFVGTVHLTKCVVQFQFSGSRIVVPYAPPPSEAVFLVLVRFAYGFLDFLSTYKSILTMPLRSTPITGASSLLRADAPWINRPFPTCAARVTPYLHWLVPERRPRFLCSLYPGFAFSFSPSLWPGCHHWPVWLIASDIWPFRFSAVFHLDMFQRRQHPTWGEWLYHHPVAYEPYIQDVCRLQQNILGMTIL